MVQSAMANDDAKRAAAEAALDELPADGIIGLGTGSTTRHFIEALAREVRDGKRYVGVPSSEATRRFASELGIPLLDDAGPWDIAVCVDGADEIDANLDLIKGGGGAHTREKILNASARTNVIIVDASKLSARLGERSTVPVEVLAFGHGAARERLAAFGRPTLRLRDGAPWRTDDGNLIVDLACGPIDDPGALDRAIHAVPGVVETGLFVGRGDVVLVASEAGIERRYPRRRARSG